MASAMEIASRTERVIHAFYHDRDGQGPTLCEKALKSLDDFGQRCAGGRTLGRADTYLEFLKRYSSWTPIMDVDGRKSLGGGYFAALNGYGCVVDPGHHFLYNFFQRRHVVDDIDGVVVTHYHDDHYADLPALLSLLYRRHKANPGALVDIFVDRMTFRMFEPILRSAKYVRNLVKLSGRSRKRHELCDGVWLEALPTRHFTFDDSVSGVGLHIGLDNRGSNLIITGDTQWTPAIEKEYRRRFAARRTRKVLVAHVSTAYPPEAGIMPAGKVPRGDERHPSHLAIRGLCRCIGATKPSSVIISEIGEELEDVIHSLANAVAEEHCLETKVGTFPLVYDKM